MAKNIAFRIKVEIVETEVEPSSDRRPHEQADGAFSLVLPEADELNISALDQAAPRGGNFYYRQGSSFRCRLTEPSPFLEDLRGLTRRAELAKVPPASG